MNRMKKMACTAATVVVLWMISNPVAAQPIELWYYWGDGCYNCIHAKDWLVELSDAYPQLLIHDKEVWNNRDNRDEFREKVRNLGHQSTVVPAFVIGTTMWSGYNDLIKAQIEQTVRDIAEGKDTSSWQDIGPSLGSGLFGQIDPSSQPIVIATLLIATVDGFNPCSLWVLTVLLGIILQTRSRKRIAAIGLCFLFVSASIYGLFISGVFSVVRLAASMGPIRIVLASAALLMAVVNIKDYFAFRIGFSFMIPDRFKPEFFRKSQKIRLQSSLPAALGMTALFSAGASILELPCTAGFPLVWSGLLADAQVQPMQFMLLFTLYLAVYFLLEVLILVLALITMRSLKMQSAHGRVLKLFGGMILGVFAILLLIRTDGIWRLDDLVRAFVIALAASMMIISGRVLYQNVQSKRR